MLVGYPLLRVIETQAESLACGLLERIRSDPRTEGYARHVPDDELRQRVFEIYSDLTGWLLRKPEDDAARRYFQIGARRARQGLPLSQLVAAIVLTKETMWSYLERHTPLAQPDHVFGELEVLRAMDRFFDTAITNAVRGYESEQSPERAA